MAWTMRVGVLIGGLVLVVVGAVMAQGIKGDAQWFPASLILIGFLAAGLSFWPETSAPQAPPRAPAPASGLREQLLELEQLSRDGLITKAEAAAKHKELVARWGGPPQS